MKLACVEDKIIIWGGGGGDGKKIALSKSPSEK